ncbi:hypothetical protein Tco_0279085 [Tanacetum coccineum]
MLTFGGRGTNTHVLLSMRALYLSHIACFQLESRRAWKGDLGIGEEGVARWVLVVVVGGVYVVCGDGVEELEVLSMELFVDLFVRLFVVVFFEEK